MKSSNKSQQYCSEFAETVVSEIVSLVESEREEHGDTFVDGANLMILGSLVGSMLYNKLTLASYKEHVVQGTAPDQLDETDLNHEYQKYKALIQDAISTGFETAMREYSGRQVDYITEISPVGESLSRMEN